MFREVILASAFFLTGADNVLAWKVLFHPACPTLNSHNTWKDYLTKPPAPGLRHSAVSVHLNKASQVNDPEARGGLNPKHCYVVAYVHSSKTYESYPSDGETDSFKANLPGDPLNNEINVWGVILLFNQAGEIVDKKGNVIGELACYGSNDACSGY